MEFPNEAELAPMPTLGEEEFLKLFEEKLVKEFAESVNETILNLEVDDIVTFQDFVNGAYIAYLEDSIGNIYSTVN
jgi:hypothetical protein